MSTAQDTQDKGSFARKESTFRNFVSRDPNSQFPAEKDRYVLYVCPGCPWAHRTMIVRLLKGLESTIDIIHVDMGPDGWYFSGVGEVPAADPLHGFKTLLELYHKVDPSFTGRPTVPVLWDKRTDTLVNNESSEIIRMLYEEFDELLPENLRESAKKLPKQRTGTSTGADHGVDADNSTGPGSGGLYPPHLRAQIDALNAWIYPTVNNGVYRAGFATTQPAHDQAIEALFSSLDRLESILATGTDPGAPASATPANSTTPADSTKPPSSAAAGGPYLLGKNLTEADIRLYTTLARFDVAYYTVFLCNRRSIRHDYSALHLWLRRLYWDADENGPLRGAFHKTTAPYIGSYGAGYAEARHRMVMKGAGPRIVPAGPAVLMEPLPGA